jgi:hypothetical protein
LIFLIAALAVHGSAAAQAPLNSFTSIEAVRVDETQQIERQCNIAIV